LTPLLARFLEPGLIIISFLGVVFFRAEQNGDSNYWKFFLLTGWFWGNAAAGTGHGRGYPARAALLAGAIPHTFIITARALYEFARLVRTHNHMYE